MGHADVTKLTVFAGVTQGFLNMLLSTQISHFCKMPNCSGSASSRNPCRDCYLAHIYSEIPSGSFLFSPRDMKRPHQWYCMPLRASSPHRQSCVLHFMLVSWAVTYAFNSCVLSPRLDRRSQCHSIVNFSLCPAEPCGRLGAVEIPCQMSPSSPRTQIKRMYALARVSAAQCADRDLCYTRCQSRCLD